MSRLSPLLFMFFSLLYAGTSAGEGKKAALEGMEAFPGLKMLGLKNEGVTLYYDPKNSEVLNVKHPNADDLGEGGIYISRPLRTQLLGTGKGYFTIDCDSGGSWDPGCTVLQESNGKLNEVIRIPGLRFAFPGNGNIYVEGHNNTMFNVRQKYEWRDGSFSAVKQPFNYVGLDTTTREPIDIFTTQDYKQIVAALPKGSSISVVLNQGEHYLVKTPFGLLGWVRIRCCAMQEASPIVGIYYAGD